MPFVEKQKTHSCSLCITLCRSVAKLFNGDVWSTCLNELKPFVIGFHNTNEDLKSATDDLISKVPMSNSSIFLSSSLHYVLSERLIRSGQMIEVFTYAKKAHDSCSYLVTKMFQFEYEEIIEEVLYEDGQTIEKMYSVVKSIHAQYYDERECSCYGDCALTPWNVIDSYLKTSLQVVSIHEIFGNVDRAVKLLKLGISISKKLSLPLFEISFYTILGKISRKRSCWKLAENDLLHANKILRTFHFGTMHCNKCLDMLKVSIDLQIGDLMLVREMKEESQESYKSALQKLFEFYQRDIGRSKRKRSQEQIGYDGINGIRSLCKSTECWECFHSKAVDCSSPSDCMLMNYEIVYRKTCLRLLVSIAKHSWVYGDVDGAHEILFQAISVLSSQEPPCKEHSSDSLRSSLESIGKNFCGDVFAAERAALLYYICWFKVKSLDNRDSCSKFSGIGITMIVSLLKQSFILSREVPLLNQKVSRLLGIIYTLSTSVEYFSLSPSDHGFESYWASFFHQASIGTYCSQNISADMVEKKSLFATNSNSEETRHLLSISKTIKDVRDLLRLAPESCKRLNKLVRRFFQGLPSTPIICISLVEGVDAGMLRELLHREERVWVFLSRLSSHNQHVVLLPITETLEVSGGYPKFDESVSQEQKKTPPFVCPWRTSAVDKVAPVFRHIQKMEHKINSEYNIVFGSELYDAEREKLNASIRKFLVDMEVSWLGDWIRIFLGEGLDSTQVECMNMKENDPIILVLDYDVAMLPWESLPTLHNQEVYRMLSVGNILETLRLRGSQAFPLIDPRDSYNLIDADGDMPFFKSVFGEWF